MVLRYVASVAVFPYIADHRFSLTSHLQKLQTLPDKLKIDGRKPTRHRHIDHIGVAGPTPFQLPRSQNGSGRPTHRTIYFGAHIVRNTDTARVTRSITSRTHPASRRAHPKRPMVQSYMLIRRRSFSGSNSGFTHTRNSPAVADCLCNASPDLLRKHRWWLSAHLCPPRRAS
ncbi:hypothetical protein FA95DRAFT_1019918 [Auriscalpium vulgare]|uniref:Uncharacterized protein n=1 Tax=Auriscalpium vulgare TaxID=40419 RepID=A0ACB8R603_9AGAM|nr:hypothetical protein FA95DRAFT_1019918 [Auriscalpium vulgare]